MTLIEKINEEGNNLDELFVAMKFMKDISGSSCRVYLSIASTLIDTVASIMNVTHEEVFNLLKQMCEIVNAEEGPIFRKDEENDRR